MNDYSLYRPSDVEPIDDPTSESGDIWVFEEGLGQEGRPFVMLVSDPPDKTRPAHYHHGDVVYFYIAGEHHIEGEGVYRAGDVRWTRAGHAYGPETTGPDGGTWWLVSAANPIPVDVTDVETANPDKVRAEPSDGTELQRFRRPFDWPAIDDAVSQAGGVVVEGLWSDEFVAQLNAELDVYLDSNAGAGDAASGSVIYDTFLGRRTVRLHGLAAKIPSGAGAIGHDEIVGWVDRMLRPVSQSALLNAGELIQIGPDESAQFLHRDTDSWPSVPLGDDPVLVNCIVALTDVNPANGATNVALGSHLWEPSRHPRGDEIAQPTLAPGDALLFRGDTIHGGGANHTAMPRRAVSLSYCAGWLRPVENSFLNVPIDLARTLPDPVPALLGYRTHDASRTGGGMVGLYENGDPSNALT